MEDKDQTIKNLKAELYDLNKDYNLMRNAVGAIFNELEVTDLSSCLDKLKKLSKTPSKKSGKK